MRGSLPVIGQLAIFQIFLLHRHLNAHKHEFFKGIKRITRFFSFIQLKLAQKPSCASLTIDNSLDKCMYFD